MDFIIHLAYNLIFHGNRPTHDNGLAKGKLPNIVDTQLPIPYKIIPMKGNLHNEGMNIENCSKNLEFTPMLGGSHIFERDVSSSFLKN
jgi:hypothetical protein